MIPYEVCVAPDMIMQIFRDIAGCAINTTSHIEGWHATLKVSRSLEECALRRQAAANAVQPFMPLSIPRKPQTVLQEIRAKNRQLGVVSSAPASAAAMERANSAPEPLVVSRASPAALSLGAPEGSSAGAMELQMHRSEPLVNQASMSLQRSGGAIASAHGRSKRAATRPSRFRDGAE